MRPIKSFFSCASTMAISLAIGSPQVQAQDQWQPKQPISLIVAYAPGGSADLLARIIQPKLASALGTTVVVENKSGGSGQIGLTSLTRAKPDGYTLGISSASTHAIHPALYGSKMPYRIPDDFTSIAQLNSQSSVLIVHPSVPAKNMEELVKWLKENPGAPYSSGGVGSSGHLIGELINEVYGVSMTHVPYRGAGDASKDLLAGHIKLMVDQMTTGSTLAGQGLVRAIAVSSTKRSPLLPDVSTFAEQGAEDFDLTSWQGLFGPAGMDSKVVDRLRAAVAETLRDPEVRKRLATLGSEVAEDDPKTFPMFIENEKEKWGKVVTRSKVALD